MCDLKLTLCTCIYSVLHIWSCHMRVYTCSPLDCQIGLLISCAVRVIVLEDRIL